MADTDALPPDPEYIVELILPSHEVHLLAGPSGAGKTRWLIHSLLEMERTGRFLDHRSHPIPWLYIAADRSMPSVTRTFDGMGIPLKRLNIIPAWDQKMNSFAVLDAIQNSPARLIIWESFGTCVTENGAADNGTNIRRWLQRASQFCQQQKRTIIGVVESPKMKPNERYENPRQRVSGAAAWSHFSETIFILEPAEVSDPSRPSRVLYVCPRNAPGAKIDLAFDHRGYLLPTEPDVFNENIPPAKSLKKSVKH